MLVGKYFEGNSKDSSNNGQIGHIKVQQETNIIEIEIHSKFPNLLIEECSLKIDQFKLDVETMVGIRDRQYLSSTSNHVYYLILKCKL